MVVRRVEPVRLFRYHSQFAVVVLAAELVFCFYIIIFLVMEVNKLRFGLFRIDGTYSFHNARRKGTRSCHACVAKAFAKPT